MLPELCYEFLPLAEVEFLKREMTQEKKPKKIVLVNKKISWMRFKWLYFLISALVIIPGIYSLLRWGLKPSIDFTGGTLLEIKSEELTIKDLEKTVNDFLGEKTKSIQATNNQTFLLRFSELKEEEKEKLLTRLEKKYGEVTIIRWETLGPTLGKELLFKTLMGIVLATLAILFYINSRFKNKSFGICAVLAMLHDTLIMLGSYSLLGHFWGAEADSLFVTAVLTILSFSVHDTVVVYDRIRELSRINPKWKLEKVANLAISQTLARSINNSLTIIFMLVALVWLGGETTRWFATALLIGTIAGTYSSTFTATPLLVVWHSIAARWRR